MVHQLGVRPDFGIVGYGRFGSFLAPHLAATGSLAVWDARWDSLSGTPPGSPQVPYHTDFAEVCRARTVILAVPISSIPETLQKVSDRLLPGTLVADTASVKVWPCRWLTEHLPPHVELLATHPLFGPDSAAQGLRGQKIAVVPLRLRRPRTVRRFLERLGLTVLTVTAEEHDRAMAETQSLVHWIGRALERTDARPRDLDTLGYRRLLEILEYVVRDSWELFVDLQRWNPYAAGVRERMLSVLRELDRELAPESPPPSP
jgi:prephenate dehydrogenase